MLSSHQLSFRSEHPTKLSSYYFVLASEHASSVETVALSENILHPLGSAWGTLSVTAACDAVSDSAVSRLRYRFRPSRSLSLAYDAQHALLLSTSSWCFIANAQCTTCFVYPNVLLYLIAVPQ
ncbi:hypothetical protein AcV5_003923 [Taiwanofungus camphoratus]|nr:hypothetical protein AcV5_003923 [Antrodia cinnamomea]